jgi:hypothetical protein
LYFKNDFVNNENIIFEKDVYKNFILNYNKNEYKEKRYLNVYMWNWKEITNEFNNLDEFEISQNKILKEFSIFEIKLKSKYKNKKSQDWINEQLKIKDIKIQNEIKLIKFKLNEEKINKWIIYYENCMLHKVWWNFHDGWIDILINVYKL